MAIIRPNFMPRAPGWVRWPAYLATFDIYLAGVCMLTSRITGDFTSDALGGGRPALGVVGFWMFSTWFGWPDGTTVQTPEPILESPAPARRRGIGLGGWAAIVMGGYVLLIILAAIGVYIYDRVHG